MFIALIICVVGEDVGNRFIQSIRVIRFGCMLYGEDRLPKYQPNAKEELVTCIHLTKREITNKEVLGLLNGMACCC